MAVGLQPPAVPAGIDANHTAVAAGKGRRGQGLRVGEHVGQPQGPFTRPVAQHRDRPVGQVADVALGGDESGPTEMDAVEVAGHGRPVGHQMGGHRVAGRLPPPAGQEAFHVAAMLVRTGQLPPFVATMGDPGVPGDQPGPIGRIVNFEDPGVGADREPPAADRPVVHLPGAEEPVMGVGWRVRDRPQAVPGELAGAVDVGEVPKADVVGGVPASPSGAVPPFLPGPIERATQPLGEPVGHSSGHGRAARRSGRPRAVPSPPPSATDRRRRPPLRGPAPTEPRS